MTRLEFIYFDLGNVLAHFDPNRACRNLGALAGRSPAVVREAVYDSNLQNRYEAGELSSNEFADAVNTRLDTTVPPERLLESLANMFTIVAAVNPFIVRLAAFGIPVGLLSNTCESHWQHLRGKGMKILDVLSPQVLSYEQGCMKPDPKIYAAAARLTGVTPELIGFTDDRPENVAAAIAAGWRAHLYRSPAQLAQWLSQQGLPISC